MKLAIERYRPVVDEELQGFRHLDRHSDAFGLDWGREREVALKMRRAGRSYRSR